MWSGGKDNALALHRAKATGIEVSHLEPIWGEPPAELVHEFVETGGRAVVTRVDLTRLKASWLGRTVDERFVDEIAATGVDPCGENGEYHSFAFEGPVFAHAVAWQPGRLRSEERFSQLDVKPL